MKGFREEYFRDYDVIITDLGEIGRVPDNFFKRVFKLREGVTREVLFKIK